MTTTYPTDLLRAFITMTSVLPVKPLHYLSMAVETHVSIWMSVQCRELGPQTPQNRESLYRVFDSIMLPMKRERFLYDYLVICDERNNPPAAESCVVGMTLKPLRTPRSHSLRFRFMTAGERTEAHAFIHDFPFDNIVIVPSAFAML